MSASAWRTRLRLAANVVALLLAAFAFQHLGGMAPCKLCLWQRWPHAAAIAIGVLAMAVPGRGFPLLGVLAMLTTAGIALYHTGVERVCVAGDIDPAYRQALLDAREAGVEILAWGVAIDAGRVTLSRPLPFEVDPA